MEQPTTAPQQFQNEEVRFTVHQRPACVVEFDVEAFGSLTKAAKHKAIKAVAKQVSLPGFRKGRVPDELVLKNYPNELDKEWQQAIATLAFNACEKLCQIRMLHREGKVTFKLKSHSLNGALLTLSFETEPNIPTIDPATLHLKAVKRPEVNEEKVAETVRQIQLFFATWEKIEDRPIQENDFLLLDVDVIEENPPSPLFSNTRFEVTKKSMAQWMYDLVLGKRMDDQVEGISVPDESASKEDQEELKPKKVRITIKKIESPTYPPLDETFIKNLGVSSKEELHEKLTQLLNKQADEHVQEALRQQVGDLLLSQFPFDLPQTLMTEETRFRFKQLGQDPEFRTYWENLPQEERNKTVQLISTQAEKAVRLFYLCRKIVHDAKLPVTAQDIPPPASTVLELLINPQKLFHHQRTPEVEHAEAYSRIVLEKAEDYLIAHASQAQ